MRTLRGRIALGFSVFGLATLIAVGGGLFVVLRDLYRESATAALADIAVPYVAQARRFGGPRGGGGGMQDLVEDLRELAAGSSDDLRVYAVGRAGGAVELGSRTAVTLSLRTVSGDGGAVRGTGVIDGVGEVVYAAAPVLGTRVASGGLTSLVLARPDTAAADALGDILRALVVAAVVLLVIGVPLAVWLSGSVSGPLARLAAAAGVVGRGDIPVTLPVTGPAEVARASAAFNAMADEVVRGRETQRQLVADLRHDLRTPITVIGGFAEALRDGTARGPAIARAAELIAEETARLEQMLGDLGDLADLERGGRTLDPVRLDAADVAREAAARFGAAASARGLSIGVRAGPEVLPVLADRLALERILANLVSNALAHARSRIELEARAVAATDPPTGGTGGWSGGGGVLLAVRDDGPGIPDAVLPRMFDRFFRGDPSRSGPGAGLGLAIVAELAAAQGGRAFAQNEAGSGARVGVVLPGAA